MSRIVVIPPTLTLARRQPDYRLDGMRHTLRRALGLSVDDWVWLSVGVQPDTKGFDRTVNALAKFPDAKLLIAGLSETNRASANLVRRTRRLGVHGRVKWLGHREDISQLMAAADLLVHPARYDTTGTAILEAVVNGLPVVTTAACGHARHVDSAGAGIVVREPFDFALFLAALEQARSPSVRHVWSTAGTSYGKSPLLYQGHSHAAEAIVQAAYDKVYGVLGRSLSAIMMLGGATVPEVVPQLLQI
jgi:UDP-glucose:(heptosyl)LPS alpha-1,3-glucosyltransferase